MPEPKPPLEKPRDKYAKVTEIMGVDEVDAESNRIMREVIRRNEENKAAKRPTGWEKPKPGA